MYNPTLPYGGLGYNFNGNFAQTAMAPQPVAQQAPAQTIDQGIKRVHGREGATMLANSLGPNKSALAVDETAVDVIWCMITDGGGFPTLKKLRFTIDDDEPKPVAVEEPKQTRSTRTNTKYVTKKEFDELKAKIKEMEGLLNDKSDSEHARTATKRATKE